MANRVNIEPHPSQAALDKFDSNVLLELFPFAIILDENMHIVRTGEKVFETWIVQNPTIKPELFFNSLVTKYFKLRRPKGISFDWKTILQLHSVIFELELIRFNENDDGVEDEEFEHAVAEAESSTTKEGKDKTTNYRLLLKGQMRFISDLNAIVFLCSPL